MKRFGTFGEYMFDLLFAPLKRGKRAANQFYIFFKVVGRIFDGMKKDVFRVRSEANVASASPVMLPVHGQDRDMPRLEGEDVESYRTRLSMKGVISEWSGTKTGILYALAALGYEESTIELLLPRPRAVGGVHRLPQGLQAKRHQQSHRHRRGGSEGQGGQLKARLRRGGRERHRDPLPGLHGLLEITPVAERLFAESGPVWLASATFWRATSRRAAPRAPARSSSRGGNNRGLGKFYQPCAFVMYEGLASCIEAGSEADSGAKIYPMCSPALRCSGTTYMTEGGEADAENTHSGRH